MLLWADTSPTTPTFFLSTMIFLKSMIGKSTSNFEMKVIPLLYPDVLLIGFCFFALLGFKLLLSPLPWFPALPGFDDLLAHHFAHLFIRDPLVIFSELLDQDNEVSADHFEVLSSLLQIEMGKETKPEPFPCRIFNRPTGRQSGSSPLLLLARSVGELNLGQWMFIWQNLKMQLFQSSLFFLPGRSFLLD